MASDEEILLSNASSESDLSPAHKRQQVAHPKSVKNDSAEDSSDDAFFPYPIACLGTDSDSESDSSEDINENYNTERNNYKWSDPVGNQPRIASFNGSPGVKIHDVAEQAYSEPHHFYSLLVTEEMLETIADQTNIHAAQILSTKHTRRLKDWTPTNKTEIKRFLGLIMWMGLVRLPSVHLYWSKDSAYYQTFPRSIMSRNRFELLLRMLPFSDNGKIDANDQLCNIQGLVDALNRNFRKYYDPDEVLYVDESSISFRQRKIYREHAKHKRAVQMLKLCSGSGYTYSLHVHDEKKLEAENITPTQIVLSLCKDVLNKGHTICTDMWHTSINLAEQLLSAHTHLIGLLKRNNREIPKEMRTKKLKRGEFVAKENEKGVTVLKWKNRRDMLLVSTKHSTEMVARVKKNCKCYNKPKVVVDYNAAKSSADLADQMSAYSTPLRKTVKWYKKMAIELLLNTSVVNAMIMYQSVARNPTTVIDFRMKLSTYLTECRDKIPDVRVTSSKVLRENVRHEMKKKDGEVQKVRQYCKGCYEKNVQIFGRSIAKNRTKKVATFCDHCKDKPHLCLQCFNAAHRDMPI